MRVYWYQLGLHFKPETRKDTAALKRLLKFFEGLGLLGYEAPASQIPGNCDQESILRAKELRKLVP